MKKMVHCGEDGKMCETGKGVPFGIFFSSVEDPRKSLSTGLLLCLGSDNEDFSS